MILRMGMWWRRIYATKKAGAKDVVLWDTGMPSREFLFTEDLADRLVISDEELLR